MRIEHAYYTSIGGRPVNEDSVFCKDNCYVVADGLGGHGNGELASAAAAEYIGNNFSGSTTDAEIERLICGADGAVHQKGSGGKSTAAIVLCSQSEIRYANIGDSRVYYFRAGRIMERSRDHSVCQAAVEMGEMTDAQVRKSEDRTGLFKVLGAETPLKLPKPYDPIAYQDGDAFLICSDGFWEYVYETEMELDLLKSENPQQWLDHMIKRLLLRSEGKGDNYTALCGFVHAGERPAPVVQPIARTQPLPHTQPTKSAKKRSIVPAVIGAAAATVVILGAFGAVKLIRGNGDISETGEATTEESEDFSEFTPFEIPEGTTETQSENTEQSGASESSDAADVGADSGSSNAQDTPAQTTAPTTTPEATPAPPTTTTRLWPDTVPATTTTKPPKTTPDATTKKPPKTTPDATTKKPPKTTPDTTTTKPPKTTPDTTTKKPPKTTPDTTTTKPPKTTPATTTTTPQQTTTPSVTTTEPQPVEVIDPDEETTENMDGAFTNYPDGSNTSYTTSGTTTSDGSASGTSEPKQTEVTS